jgi:serine/threonine protein kinase
MQPVEHLQPGTIFAKDFRVVRIVAQGGMGAVYEAEEVEGGRRVALKLMHPSQITDPKLRKRFAQEARVGAWIGSEHIVEVHCAGIDERSHVPWLAMELLKGETLAARITKNLPARGLPHDEAWRVLSQLCRALSAAHEKGVVHRDLKPENVFLTSQARTDAPFTVKVLDFGIAKRLDPNDRAQNKTAAIGTPLWMSPEQNENVEITPAADVWAVGLLAFRMFTGRFYWLSANERELNLGWLYSELVSEPLAPASQRADMFGAQHLLPANLDPWFARCIARDPRQRFANAKEMTDALVALAPPAFAPYGRSSLAPSDSAPTTMMAAAPQMPVAPTLALSSPPPPVMGAAPSYPPLAHTRSAPPPARGSRKALGLVVALVLVASALGGFWALSASSADAPPDAQPVAQPAMPSQAPSQMPALPPMPVEQGVSMGASQMPPTTPSNPLAPGVVPQMPRGMRGGTK